MAKTKSAGILVYRGNPQKREVLLVHPGGPYWKNKDLWGIPKGKIEDQENPLEAAEREFFEETGLTIPINILAIRIGPVSTKRKILYSWAIKTNFDLSAHTLISNNFEIEWPRGSGKIEIYPEIDQIKWFSIEEAKQKILHYQKPLLNQLEKIDGLEKFQEVINKGKFKLASKDVVKLFENNINYILEVLGHPEAIISDLSSIWDFLTECPKDKWDLKLQDFSEKFGFEIKPETLIIDIAKKVVRFE